MNFVFFINFIGLQGGWTYSRFFKLQFYIFDYRILKHSRVIHKVKNISTFGCCPLLKMYIEVLSIYFILFLI